MLRTLILTIAALASTLLLTPVAQATPKGCADYIKVCARPGATSTGGGGARPFYAVLRDPITHLPAVNAVTGAPIKTCRSACDHVDPADRVLGD